MTSNEKPGEGRKKPGPSGSRKAKERQRQAFPTFPAFQWWVIGKLENIVASKAPNVVNYMVTRWIEEHDGDLLKRYGASFDDWKRSLGPQGVVRTLDERVREQDQVADRPEARDDEANGDGSDSYG